MGIWRKNHILILKNMMTPNFSRDLAFAEVAMGSPTITWKGNSYVCVPSITTEERMLETGGFYKVMVFSFTVRIEILPATLPQSKELVIYKGQEYRIDVVKDSAVGDFITLECTSPDNGDV